MKSAVPTMFCVARRSVHVVDTPTTSGIATMRAQVKSVGRLKNIAAIVPNPSSGSALRSAIERARLELAGVVEEEGLDELPRLRQARHVAERRGAAHRVGGDLERVLGLARLAQDSMRRTLPSPLSSISSTGIASSWSGTGRCR